ncbi:hypothetical protein OSB04_019993 [Centaurea solstitialis]|uniref:CCHC-type domain-containing protein n=1 Tax=Centaurea solstitialis TaxID=347529 RepID=A0AA38T3K6_9ASTR|nr:hypothetical protein OSB04_019993 [Centaurea solstitialis]
MAMLTMRIKRFIKRTGRNNFCMKREDAAGFDKSKVRCYKCDDLGHFARECKGVFSNQQYNNKPQPSKYNNKNTNGGYSQALVSQEGLEFDWSDQANEEKKQYEIKLSKYRTELEKVKTELDEAKSDIEKFSKASKAMDEILKSQIYDDLKRGIRYNITPPPYNNNYIPPKSDLFDRLDRQELKEGVSKVDPKDRVEVEDVIEENVPKIDENIPFENHILTNEKGGRSFVERKKIKGKEKNKFAQRKIQNKRVEKNANKLVKIWVPKAAVSDTTYSTTNSTSSRNTIDGSSTVSTTNSISTDNQLVNTSTVHKRTPLIVTRYSSQKIQNSDHLLKSKLTKGNKGRMKSIWHVDGGCSRHMTGIMSHLEDFKKFDGGHVAFGDNPKGGKISGKGTVSKGQMTFDDNDDLEDKELDDLYNDLRVFEADVEAKKKRVGYTHNAALLSNDSTALSNTTASESNTATKQDPFGDSILEAFLASHVKSSQINEDLEQINADDLEEMDIK